MGRGSVIEETVERTIEKQSWIDRLAAPIQKPVFNLMERSGTLRSVLNGTWLGHPVHPALTDVPIGTWTAGFVLDLLDMVGINRRLRRASDVVQTIGFFSAIVAALPGLADWSYTRNRPRRVGFVHGLTNLVIVGIYGASLAARRRGDRGTGVALSALGYGLLMFSSWLGGTLAYRFGIGVNHAAFEAGPREFTPVFDDAQLREGDVRCVEANGMPIMLTRYLGQVYAIGDTCTHLGCSLHEGRMVGDEIVCPCHGSHFRISDGSAMVGPASAPEIHFDVRVVNGRIEVRQAA